MFQKNRYITPKRTDSAISQSYKEKENEQRSSQKYTANNLPKKHRF
jgi:hypothetical protein